MNTSSTDTMLVITSIDDAAAAAALARALVTRKQAACVSILPQATSIYDWEGTLQESSEQVLMIKTQAASYTDVQDTLLELHPYELPEIIAVPISQGLTPYLNWIKDSCSS